MKTSLNVLTTDSYVRDNWREMGGRFNKVFVNLNDGTVFVKNKKLKGGD